MAISPISLIRGIKYTAVDFGHHSIKIMNCRVKNGRMKLLDSAYREFPIGTISNGRLDDVHLMEKLLASIFEEEDINPGVIVFTPASGQELIRKIELPAMPDKEIKEALNWEIQEYVDMPPDRVAMDYVILNESEDGLEILLTVLPKDVLKDYLEVFKRNSLEASIVNLEELALISLLEHQECFESPAIFVNIGDSQTKILIASNDDYILSRTVEIAGDHFTGVFMNEERNREEAENEKKRFEFDPGEADDSDMDLALMMSEIETDGSNQSRVKNLLDELITQIERSIEYYMERNPELPLSALYLTGGGSRLNGLEEYFKKELDIDIKRLKPYNNIDTGKISTTGESMIMAVTAGLIASEVLYNES